MVLVLILLLTRFHVNVAHSNGNPTSCTYSAFLSYIRREGHLYEVFLVLAKTHLIYEQVLRAVLK